MAIQINNINVIDDDRNINAGVITATSIDVTPTVITFSPSAGSTAAITTNIVLTFAQSMRKGTGNITLRDSSGIGTVLQTIGVSSDSVTISGGVVTIDPPSNLPFNTNVFPVIDEGAFEGSFGNGIAGITTYNFNTPSLALGDPYEGGYLICQSGGTQWIVSSQEAQVQRNWTSRTDSNTRAQEVSGCSGWFVPNCNQAVNPGFACRQYWDSYSSSYWTDTCAPCNQYNQPQAWYINMNQGTLHCTVQSCQYNQAGCLQIRSFRCVSY